MCEEEQEPNLVQKDSKAQQQIAIVKDQLER